MENNVSESHFAAVMVCTYMCVLLVLICICTFAAGKHWCFSQFYGHTQCTVANSIATGNILYNIQR